jgi:hypothetical protein
VGQFENFLRVIVADLVLTIAKKVCIRFQIRESKGSASLVFFFMRFVIPNCLARVYNVY